MPLSEQAPRVEVYVPPKRGGDKGVSEVKSPVMTVVPPGGLVLTSVILLPRPRTSVLAGSIVPSEKQIPLVNVTEPVVVKKPCAFGPVCFRFKSAGFVAEDEDDCHTPTQSPENPPAEPTAVP